jgi:hypothetical protein
MAEGMGLGVDIFADMQIHLKFMRKKCRARVVV